MSRAEEIIKSKELLVVEAADLDIKWNGIDNSRTFRCRICGHKFQLENKFIHIMGTSHEVRNFFCCGNCFTTHEETANRMLKIEEDSKTTHWWLWEDLIRERQESRYDWGSEEST